MPDTRAWVLGLRCVERVERGEQPRRGNRPIRVPADHPDLVPIDVAVEAQAEPPAPADVGRPEVPVMICVEEMFFVK
jgi:hypothetical protein